MTVAGRIWPPGLGFDTCGLEGQKHVAYLAGVQHVSNSSSAEVSSGDDVFLPTRVPRSHRLRRCHGDSFGHTDELLWCGCLGWRVRTAEHLIAGSIDR